MDMVERVIREATAKSKDGRIDVNDFLNYASATTRYGLFSPMEASIIFHFAGRGEPGQRLALLDFASLLDPRWRSPSELDEEKVKASVGISVVDKVFRSAWYFALGGLAGGTGALTVYPIDLGELFISSIHVHGLTPLFFPS